LVLRSFLEGPPSLFLSGEGCTILRAGSSLAAGAAGAGNGLGGFKFLD